MKTPRSNRKSYESLVEDAKRVGARCLYSYADYRNKDQRLPYECNKCGNQWHTSAGNIRSGKGCRKCGVKKRAKSQRFPYADLQQLCSTIGLRLLTPEQNFKNLQQKIDVECTACKKRYSPIANSARRGHGCLDCSSSAGEKVCRRLMESILDAKFPTKRPIWLINKGGARLELDGYCEELGIAFEHHGLQHTDLTFYNQRNQEKLDRQIEHDKIKRSECKKRGIRFLEFYRLSHNTQLDPEKLRACFIEEFARAGLPLEKLKDVDFDIGQWRIRQTKIDEISERVKHLGIRCVSRSYVDSSSRYRFACNKCEYRWSTYLINALRGVGCPRCSGYENLDTKKVQAWLKQNKYLELIGDFVNSTTKIEVRCPEGHLSRVYFYAVKSWKFDCPVCHGNARKSLADIQPLAESRQLTLISDVYVNARTPLTWKCARGHRWDAASDKIRLGQSCPICAGKTRNRDHLIQYLRDYGIKLISTEFIGTQATYLVRCPSGHQRNVALPLLKRRLRTRVQWCGSCRKK